GGAQDGGDGLEGRRLPSAVAPDQRHDLAVPDHERDALHRLDGPVAHPKAAQLEDRRHLLARLVDGATPQVRLDDLRVSLDLLGRAGSDPLTEVEDRDDLAET